MACKKKQTVFGSGGVNEADCSCSAELNKLDETLQAILACIGGYTGANVFVMCAPDDSSTRFLVQATYNPKEEAWSYTRTDGTPVVEGVDFVACPLDNNNQIDCPTCV